jgi:hypothetical protein
MALQYSTPIRNAQLNQVEIVTGTAPILEGRTGAPPANCAAADSGTLLFSMTLPSDWMADAASGSKAKLGTWSDASANATGTAAHFRIKDSTGTTCHMQGTIGQGSGDISLVSTSIVATQPVTIDTFSIAAGNP